MTVSARKFVAKDIVFILIGAVLIVGAFFGVRALTSGGRGLVIRGAFFQPEIMSTQSQLQQGLSGRDGINRDAVMLFKFEAPGRHCMWMKDMKFPIDMVWLDEANRVTAIERNVAPSTYPESFCHDGKAVAEFAAGTADRLPLYVGDSFRY